MIRYFCVVDKCGGESHSFVDGMLLKVLRSYASVQICYSRGPELNSKPYPSSHLIAPVDRKGIGRLLYPLWCVAKFWRIKGDSTTSSTVVFIRNEVVALLLFSVLKRLRPSSFTLHFQSSFPHEEFNAPKSLKRIIRLALKWGLHACSQVFVVSQGATCRIRDLGATCPIQVIPLCCDFPAITNSSRRDRTDPITFVYVGTYDKHRDLGVVLQAFEMLANTARDFRVVFYGGTVADLIRSFPDAEHTVHSLVAQGRLAILGRLSRHQIPDKLAMADVGLNLIPPKPMYLESSSTKLGEYLSQGLTVVSSKGIPYHEDIHGKGDIGYMTRFNATEMFRIFEEIISAGRPAISSREKVCIQTFLTHLQYSSFVELLLPPAAIQQH